MSIKRVRRAASKSRRPTDATPGQFNNRELSWLAFNERVLEEAADLSNPLLERVKFAAITASNLDEFYMVRVARLTHAVNEGDSEPDPSGLTPVAQLRAVSAQVHDVVARLYRVVMTDLLPALNAAHIRIVALTELDDLQRSAVAAYFVDEVLPALTPLAIDESRPFPLLSSLSLNLALRLAPDEGDDRPRLAIVQLPSRLPRLVRVAPRGQDPIAFVFLEDIIRANLDALFPGQRVLETVALRLLRDSELELDDEGGHSYLEAIEEELLRRRRNKVVRLEVESGASDDLVTLLAREVSVRDGDVYRIPGPLDLRALMPLGELSGFDRLRAASQKPVPALTAEQEAHIFDVLDQGDLLLHHPYDSFDPVVALVEQAADDSEVLAIKQTLYRPGTDSPIVKALERAAIQGKQVTVVVELMARFDEERNIQWARALEEAGAHVIYGIRGLKVHAKICLVVRRTPRGIRRYVHLGTGNYNHRTARLYTDFGLLTSSPEIGVDASAFFNALTGFSDPPRMRQLVMSPTHMRERIVKLIERETRRAQEGQPAAIRAKMNALVDDRLVEALYRASRAGVRVQLNVRGICALRPGVPGLSENISVVSIVGRFLEHARIFHFLNGGDDDVYLSSADWMPRNLDRRIELMVPVASAACRKKVLDALELTFQDNTKGRRLLPDGSWRVPQKPASTPPMLVQQVIYEQTRRAFDRRESASPEVFAPITKQPMGTG